MNPFDWFYHFITDRKKKITHRIAVIVICIFAVILVDNALGLSFHFRINNKLEELKKVDLIIQNPLSDSITKSYANYLRYKIINRKSLIDYLSFRQTSWKLNNINNPVGKPNEISSLIKNEFSFLISTGGFFIAMGIFFLFLISLDRDESVTFTKKLGLGLIFFGVLSGIGLITSLLFRILVSINNKWGSSYLLNLGIQVLLFLIIFVIVNKLPLKRKPSN